MKTKPKNKRKVDVVKRWFQEIGMSKKQIAQRREEWVRLCNNWPNLHLPSTVAVNVASSLILTDLGVHAAHACACPSCLCCLPERTATA